MKIRSIAALITSCASLAACDGLRQAFTAHVDVAARAERQELSVTRLSDLLGNSTIQIPVNRETAMILTDLWTNYQLLGVAAANVDTVFDPKLIDDAAMGITANARLRDFMAAVNKTAVPDSATESSYTQATGGLFVARHILLPIQGGATQPQKDSVRRSAESLRAQANAGNFGALAKRHSKDPGSAQQNGNLGPFRRDEMVKPFADAVAALRPGQISPVVETQYGYHIIYRPTYAEAKAQYDQAFQQSSAQRSESVYVAKVDAEANINVRANAGAAAKAAAQDLSAHRDDNDVLASYKGGQLTVARFTRWVESFPPGMRIAQQMAAAPDSLVKQFVKSIARNEVLLLKADSAGIKVPAEQQQQLYADFRNLVGTLWQQLGIDPRSLADSARSAPERERLAAARVEAYLDRILTGQAQPISIPLPVQSVLRSKYEAKVFPAGVDRGVESARKLRAAADSTRAAQQPRSQVPLPMPPSDSAARDTTGGKRP